MRKKKSGKTNLENHINEVNLKGLKKSLGNPDEKIDEDIRLGRYSLKQHISRSSWLKKGTPAQEAIKWLYLTVFKNPKKYHHRKHLLYQGHLYAFEYFEPKFKKELEYFDMFPLVLSLGPTNTNLGVRNVGLNLHFLPIKIRVLVLVQIFEFYRRLYRYRIIKEDDKKPVHIDYRYIVKKLAKYGVEFCVRMYIPSRQRQIVKFPYKEWAKAIFIPSRGYKKIRANQLIKKWEEFLKSKQMAANYNMSWASIFK